jgi:hypothetical protein
MVRGEGSRWRADRSRWVGVPRRPDAVGRAIHSLLFGTVVFVVLATGLLLVPEDAP